MEYKIPKKNKQKSWELVNPIILLEIPEEKDLKPSEYIDYICHNTPGESTSGKFVIIVPIFDSGTSKKLIFLWLKRLSRKECYYWSTHVQMHGKGTQSWR